MRKVRSSLTFVLVFVALALVSLSAESQVFAAGGVSVSPPYGYADTNPGNNTCVTTNHNLIFIIWTTKACVKAGLSNGDAPVYASISSYCAINCSPNVIAFSEFDSQGGYSKYIDFTETYLYLENELTYSGKLFAGSDMAAYMYALYNVTYASCLGCQGHLEQFFTTISYVINGGPTQYPSGTNVYITDKMSPSAGFYWLGGGVYASAAGGTGSNYNNATVSFFPDYHTSAYVNQLYATQGYI